MTFSMSFSPPLAAVAELSSGETDGLDDYFVLAMTACQQLADAEGAAFRIGGFGHESWPVDVAYDMSTVVEKLPIILAGVRDRREVELDMYSQGIERKLIFKPAGDFVVVDCLSRTSWIPDPSSEKISREVLVAMLSKFAVDVAVGLKAINSELVEFAPFADWSKGRV
jgi:hypothetical protein